MQTNTRLKTFSFGGCNISGTDVIPEISST